MDLCISLNVYTPQLPQHTDKIAQILQTALICYVRRYRDIRMCWCRVLGANARSWRLWGICALLEELLTHRQHCR
jgi:hypothetical protein